MAIQIITAEQRLAQPVNTNLAIIGPAGIGKTTLTRTLPPEETLFIDIEGGTLALADWRGDVIDVFAQSASLNVHGWELARALACLIGGQNPSAAEAADKGASYWYGRHMHAQYVAALGQEFVDKLKAKYRYIVVDSISDASRLCFAWSLRQPRSISDKTGKVDTRGTYGLLGEEMVEWLQHLQHQRTHSVIVIGKLDVIKDKDIPGRVSYEPSMEGSKTGRELPFIFDIIITMGLFAHDASTNTVRLDFEKGTHRGLVTAQNNGFGVPAKDRSGSLDPIEAPDLGALLRKIAAGVRKDGAINISGPAAA